MTVYPGTGELDNVSLADKLRAKAVRLDQNLTAKRFAALNIETKDAFRIVVWEFDVCDGSEFASIADIYELPTVDHLCAYFNRLRVQIAAQQQIIVIETVTHEGRTV